jgi:hypothetical protein
MDFKTKRQKLRACDNTLNITINYHQKTRNGDEIFLFFWGYWKGVKK